MWWNNPICFWGIAVAGLFKHHNSCFLIINFRWRCSNSVCSASDCWLKHFSHLLLFEGSPEVREWKKKRKKNGLQHQHNLWLQSVAPENRILRELDAKHLCYLRKKTEIRHLNFQTWENIFLRILIFPWISLCGQILLSVLS